MAYKEKKRLLRSQTFKMHVDQVVLNADGSVFSTTPNEVKIPLYSWQITGSEGHKWPEGRSERDIGGPFETIKSVYHISHWENTFQGMVPYVNRQDWYNGNVLILHPDVDLSAFTNANPTISNLAYYAKKEAPFTDDLDSRGTALIARSIPTNPTVDSSVGLAELFREGIPSMIGSTLLRSRVGFLRGLGSEYLNYEFGWKPLVSDVRNAAKAIIESEAILKQLTRDSGKNVRRRRHFLPVRTVTTATQRSYGYPRATESGYWWNSTTTQLTDEYTRNTWFSGCYTFEYDPGNLSEISKIATQARILYGAQLNPEVLWNLAPWSWLVDWFANVGPLLHNVSAFQNDQLVLRYGYVMDRNQRSFTQVTNCVPGNSGNKLPTRYREIFQLDWKRRKKATPYGFGIASSSFTIRQWAILSALGITRAPKTL